MTAEQGVHTGAVLHNKSIVLSGMVRLAGALVNPSGEFLLLVIMSRLNSSTVASLCLLCMCGLLSDRDTAVRSSETSGGDRVTRAPCEHFRELQKHVTEQALMWSYFIFIIMIQSILHNVQN